MENEKAKDVRIPLYVQPDLKLEIEEEANRLGLKTSNAYIRMLIIQDLENKKNKN